MTTPGTIYQLHPENDSGDEQVKIRLRELTEQMIDNPILDAIEQGTLSQDEWREFAKQR